MPSGEPLCFLTSQHDHVSATVCSQYQNSRITISSSQKNSLVVTVISFPLENLPLKTMDNILSQVQDVLEGPIVNPVHPTSQLLPHML
jgi:hypothetical protein